MEHRAHRTLGEHWQTLRGFFEHLGYCVNFEHRDNCGPCELDRCGHCEHCQDRGGH